ncbi:peptide ABC transporter substrate-binding protein [Fictibacillus sp. KIGAM418]|uniref:Peptide ABC transporter substrate-binding protein n=1 Tax=Fictibacillus marinisediminis TaxID=2878389 RepID=A0A9X1X9K9_9BACL|nr:peptide ABC transporter substrate-binding protein [Fictibacillus marinisediminis]MCK6256742.1 peptide ABC transporter substrate-binding protein [Fictibacillus marinisediminis]
MKKSKWSLLLTIVLVLSVFLSACSGKNGKDDKANGNASEGNGSSSKEKVLNLLDSSEIPYLDNIMADDSVSLNVANNVYEGLYTLDDKDQPVLSGAAEEPQEKDGGKTWVFKLRDDAVWNNGEKVTANDYVFAWRKAVAKETATQYSFIYQVAGILNADKILNPEDKMYNKTDQLGVKAIDDHTLEVKFAADPASKPYTKAVLSFPTFYPQNEAFVKKQGKEFALEADKALYNGPYTLSKWEHEKGWQLKKNPKYWDKNNVKVDTINVNVVKEEATRINLFETGKADRTTISAEYVDQYKDKKDIFSTVPESTLFFLRMNQKNKALANENIRHALDMGWDKKQLTDVLLNNGSVPAYFLVPSKFVNGPDGSDFREKYGDLNKGDAKKAKELWEKGLKELGTKKVELTLLNYDSDTAQKDAQFIKNQLEKNLPGLSLKIKPQPFKQKLKLEEKLDYDISYAGWGPDYPDPMTFVDMFVTGSPHNEMNYSNKKYDDLIKKASSETDLKKRWAMMQDAEKILIQDDAAISPMYQRGLAYITKPNLKNVVNHSFGGDFSYKNWDVK